MANKSPMISIPKKATDEVDWTTPIRNLIAKSYGENPDNYAAEYASLQRCRQDAVRGAGSDGTARDLLYKYFGQLELLELRFSEIHVNFPWRDAFTNDKITQTSIAYEKASILFQIAATHSSLASSQSRSDPEGVKRAYHYFRTCAGMLTYINENFLHAPSTDLSREVIKFLVNVILAQATEVFFEKIVDEKKGNVLISKIGAQAASMYVSLTEEAKEFMGKQIFDRNWITLIQIKAKYFVSMSQYYRGLADSAADKHGEALVRFNISEASAKEASRIAASFSSAFVPKVSSTLPADAGSAIQERTKAHLAVITERRNDTQRENDLIYNAILPSAEALPAISKTAVATPIPIQEVFGTPEVQKTIGQDFFIRLIPLSVHESASVYSEEKAKLVRSEVEKAEAAESESRSVLDDLNVKAGLSRFRAIAYGGVNADAEIPVDVRRWKEDISLIESRESVDSMFNQLNKLKDAVKSTLERLSTDLETESRSCEAMRIKYEHLWSQPPSAGLTRSLRQDLKSHFGSIEAASASDNQVIALWGSVHGDIQLLLGPQVEEIFRQSADDNASAEDLLGLDIGGESASDAERSRIRSLVADIDERIGILNKLSRERNEVLKDLKEKVQTDDVSHLLLLNRRNSGVEPALFSAELEKFKPYQQRLSATVQHQEITLQEISTLWKTLRDTTGRGPSARKWDERENRKQDTVRRFSRARDVYMEVRDGLAKGLQFYNDLTGLTQSLQRNVASFVSGRTSERDDLVAQIEVEKRLSSAPSSSAKPPLPPPPHKDFNSSFASMSLQNPSSPPPSQWQQSTPPPQQYYRPPATNQYQSSPSSFMPPPPPPVSSDPYSSLGMLGSYSQPLPQHTPASYQQYQQNTGNGLPPPPPPMSYQSAPPGQYNSYSTPPPQNYGGHQG